jgi:hypothetical protein
MAIVTMRLPKCDKCGSISLPREKMPDGTLNPARENPALQKRCPICKSPYWNAGKPDRQKRSTHIDRTKLHIA